MSWERKEEEGNLNRKRFVVVGCSAIIAGIGGTVKGYNCGKDWCVWFPIAHTRTSRTASPRTRAMQRPFKTLECTFSCTNFPEEDETCPKNAKLKLNCQTISKICSEKEIAHHATGWSLHHIISRLLRWKLQKRRRFQDGWMKGI